MVEIIKEGVTKPQKSVEIQTNKMFNSDIKGIFRALILVKKEVFSQSTEQKLADSADICFKYQNLLSKLINFTAIF